MGMKLRIVRPAREGSAEGRRGGHFNQTPPCPKRGRRVGFISRKNQSPFWWDVLACPFKVHSCVRTKKAQDIKNQREMNAKARWGTRGKKLGKV